VGAGDESKEREPSMATENPYRRSLLRQERSIDTRRKLVRAAQRLWSEKGYDNTTVEEICSEAGVGRTTYYLHFSSKEQLLVELTHATAQGVAADLEHAPTTGDLDEQLSTFVDGLVRRMDAVPRSLAALTIRSAIVGSIGFTRASSEVVLFEDIFTDILVGAQRRGELRGDFDAREIGDVLGGMTMDALERWASESSDASLEHNLNLRISLVLDGLRTA
jgi:AcrR family transcriptional regulator